ncbi:MAG: hypothetical protein KF758_16280 [Anaerolineales bacterium]|nr:hypothetical protein [Anaerolineales bacterium]
MSLTFTSPAPTLDATKSLSQAILETLAYSDIFDYPLTLDELHKYLTISATKEEIKNHVSNINHVGFKEGYYFLENRADIVGIRKTRSIKSIKSLKRALFYGKILGLLPFARMVSITGSLAVLNLSKLADMDYMLVTQPNRLWLARACAVTFGRLMRLFGDKICVNLLVSENALLWPLHDLYSAREMCQMIPITGFATYQKLLHQNQWTKTFLPNASLELNHFQISSQDKSSLLQKLLEFLFKGRFGDFIENWAMKLQLNHIFATYGKGLETNFSADICQGNFHDHRKWADEVFAERLNALSLWKRGRGEG